MKGLQQRTKTQPVKKKSIPPTNSQSSLAKAFMVPIIAQKPLSGGAGT